ncbi:hypothetical protein F4780DRAFT_201062 [Xylariomycetidae sp. FL0641]|nr:hypothetical protein F4780DRAFT_201062 [Xylariomycetidae sp. FL0641]
MTKPTILVVPGAFHPAASVDALLAALHRLGFPAEAHATPSVGRRDVSAAADAAFLRGRLLALAAAGREVVLLTHSYSGVPGGSAIAGLAGAGGGVVRGIVYLAAFVAGPDEPLFALLGNAWPAWFSEGEIDGLKFSGSRQPEVFYNDCDAATADAVTATLEGHSALAFRTAAAPAGWREPAFDGRRAFVRCLRDAALPIAAQDAMIEKASREVPWITKTLDASHSPFLSMPMEVARVVEELAAEFAAA